MGVAPQAFLNPVQAPGQNGRVGTAAPEDIVGDPHVVFRNLPAKLPGHGHVFLDGLVAVYEFRPSHEIGSSWHGLASPFNIVVGIDARAVVDQQQTQDVGSHHRRRVGCPEKFINSRELVLMPGQKGPGLGLTGPQDDFCAPRLPFVQRSQVPGRNRIAVVFQPDLVN